MFQLIKSMGTKTIAIITVTIIAVLLGFTYYLYHDNTAVAEQVGELKVENGIIKQNEDFAQQSTTITDRVVTETVVKKREVQHTTDRLRRETLDEYVKQIEAPQKTGEPDGAERARVFARGLHEQYCSARPEDPDCRPVNANP